MIPFDVRIENFLESVSFIADENRQRAMWIDGDPGRSFMISLGEIYAQFFDDNDIDNFISHELDASPLTPSQRVAIRSFRDSLNDFEGAPGRHEGPTSDAELLMNPEWNKIVSLAKATLSEFKNMPRT